MHDLRLVQRGDAGHEHLGPGDVPRPHGRIARRRHLRAPVGLALLLEHVLEVARVGDELEGREVGAAAPRLLERVDQTNRVACGLAVANPARQLLLVLDELRIPDHRRRRRLVLLEKDLRAARPVRRVRDRHHPRAEDLRDAVSADRVSDPQLLRHARVSVAPPLQSATVSAERDTLAASCLSVVRKFAGSPVNFCSASCAFSPSYSTTSHSLLSIWLSRS